MFKFQLCIRIRKLLPQQRLLKFVAPSCTAPRPPLTRGLSAEQADWGRENVRFCSAFLSLRPFGAPPSSEGGGALPRQCN